MNELAANRTSRYRVRLKQFRRRITYSGVFLRFISALAAYGILLYYKTLKVRFYGHSEYLKLDPQKCIYALWHGRQFLIVPFFYGRKFSIIVDLSWAGEIISRILRRFGYVVVRGSSKRKGARALLEFIKVIRRGYAGVFTMDGPRGPIYKAKPGILYMAMKLELPIVPLTFSADQAWVLEQSWDRYLIPKPFSRCCVAIGKPIWDATVKEALSVEELDRISMEWMAETDRRVGRIPEAIEKSTA